MKVDYERLFSRNLGLISKKEQKVLKNTSIGIAGVGSDGGLLAERLVRFGIGKIILADPDCFELNNINRQFGANIETVGKNKAQIIAKELKLINPNLKIIVFKEGLTPSNVKKFVDHSTVIVDEIDYLKPEISVLLHREARNQKKYIFMAANIGWGVSIFCFSPTGMSFEEYFQYNLATKTINLFRYVKKIPKYFNQQTVNKVINQKIPIPNISSSVGLAASLLSAEIILFLLKKRKPIFVPKIIFFDAYTRKIEIR